jgi:hypothetical protein
LEIAPKFVHIAGDKYFKHSGSEIRSNFGLVLKMSGLAQIKIVVESMNQLFVDETLHGRWIPDEMIVRSFKTSFEAGILTVPGLNKAFSDKEAEHYWNFGGRFLTNKRSVQNCKTSDSPIDVTFYCCNVTETTRKVAMKMKKTDWQTIWWNRPAKRSLKRTV